MIRFLLLTAIRVTFMLYSELAIILFRNISISIYLCAVTINDKGLNDKGPLLSRQKGKEIFLDVKKLKKDQKRCKLLIRRHFKMKHIEVSKSFWFPKMHWSVS